MAREVDVYVLNEPELQRREIQARDGTRLTLPEWLAQRPAHSDVRSAILRGATAEWRGGVSFVTSFRRVGGWFPDLAALAERYPELGERFVPVDYFTFDGVRSPLVAYTKGADFPPGYSGWLTAVNTPGWQLFRHAEMARLAAACETLLATAGSPFAESWRELINAHMAEQYDLALFVHEP